jgi:hypothetical protein
MITAELNTGCRFIMMYSLDKILPCQKASKPHSRSLHDHENLLKEEGFWDRLKGAV